MRSITSAPSGAQWLELLCRHIGRLNKAKQTADDALTLARARGERGFEAWALRLLAQLVATSARFDDAYGIYRAALATAGELEMRPLVAHCHADLAKLCRRLGQGSESDEHFLAAVTMYRDMGMTHWLGAAQTTAAP